MVIKRLLRSIARDLMPYAELEFPTPFGLRLCVPDRGAWSRPGDVLVARSYDSRYAHLKPVRCVVDLGSNNGFFSFSLLDYLTPVEGKPPATRALLGDANDRCVAQVQRAIVENGLQATWRCQHLVVGPPGQVVHFKHAKDSLHSNVFARGRAGKTLHYQVTDLSALLGGERDVFDLIKIDIEGAELFLFRHNRDILKKFRFGLCEWHAPQFDGPAMREALAGLGFELMEIRSHAIESYDLSRGHSWNSPAGMALWKNPSTAT